ncbi:MAG: hypothetical protein WCI05_09285 [Myxococcales bacterium]
MPFINTNQVTASMTRTFKTMEGNEALAHISYRTSEVICVYPITPASPMGEYSETWSAEGKKNIWGTVPKVDELQSEAGAAAAVHGALQTGALTTTFTASQGLLLMIPNMYKIAGELTPCAIHVSARSLAAQGLSIFGDHSDVMSVRGTGFALLASSSVQEVMDMALITAAATLESRVPFLHFFDGFRTSHEISKIEVIADTIIKAMVSDDLVIAHRNRRLSPDVPVLRGTSQNPDVYFQARESVNSYYDACPGITEKAMTKFGELTGRHYKLYEYYGAPDATRVIVLMGSGVETARETMEYLNKQGEKVGVIHARLFRPFDVDRFVKAFPATVTSVSVLDRVKEPGSAGEPLHRESGGPVAYQDQVEDLAKVGGDVDLSVRFDIAGVDACDGAEPAPDAVASFDGAGVRGETRGGKARSGLGVGGEDDGGQVEVFPCAASGGLSQERGGQRGSLTEPEARVDGGVAEADPCGGGDRFANVGKGGVDVGGDARLGIGDTWAGSVEGGSGAKDTGEAWGPDVGVTDEERGDIHSSRADVAGRVLREVDDRDCVGGVVAKGQVTGGSGGELLGKVGPDADSEVIDAALAHDETGDGAGIVEGA